MGPNDNQTCIICEQGDMGLFGDPLNEADQQKYNKETEKENADEK